MVAVKSNNNITYRCAYHLVWCPKYRRPVITTDETVIAGDPGPVDARFKEIAAEVCAEVGAEIIEIETTPDHVHLLVSVDPQFGIHKLAKLIKGRTSRYLRAEFPSLRRRLPTLWTNSYFVATVGGSPLSTIKEYVANQRNV